MKEIEGCLKQVRGDAQSPICDFDSELEYWTSLGWVLVAMSEESQFTHGQIDCPGNDCRHQENTYGSKTWCNQRIDGEEYLTTTTLFILRKGIDNRIHDLLNEKGNQEHEVRTAHALSEKFQEQQRAAEERATKLEADLAQAENSASEEKDKRYAMEEIKDKMEQDIGKLREQFGEKAIKEALDA